MVSATINESRPVDHALVQRLQQELSLWKNIVKKVICFNGQESFQSFLSTGQQQSTSELLLNEQELNLAVALLKELNFSSSSAAAGMANIRRSHDQFPSSSMKSSSGLQSNSSLSISTSIDHGNNHRSSSATNVNSHQQNNNPFQRGYSEEELQGIINNNNSVNSLSGKVSPGKLNPYSQYNQQREEEQAGGGLEYVISLEKALNKEQIHAQHLSKKNETLIKEIEELKFNNMQLNLAQQPLQRPISSSQGRPFSRNGSGNVDLSAHVNTLTTVSDVFKSFDENISTAYQFHDSIQKVMKKFFKFQMEEEEMKQELNKVRLSLFLLRLLLIVFMFFL
jgi:hypothetical protein